MEYTIAAIPTLYNGRQYRSRLEARWAAFFDLLHWPFEYEPFDLGKWSPDFLLLDFRALVEVKPITEADQDTFDKMRLACSRNKMFGDGGEDDQQVMALVLAGVAPAMADGKCQVGWWASDQTDWKIEAATVVWNPSQDRPIYVADIGSVEASGFYTASGNAGSWGRNYAPRLFGRYTLELWSEAANRVQWQVKYPK